MTKSTFFKCILIFAGILIWSFGTCFVFADNTDTSDTLSQSNSSDVQQKEKLLSVINDCEDEIKSNFKDMDDMLNSLDKTEEYDKYPAVRLNVDTPFFGLSSMVDNKLKIKNDVSTVDVANGYSIKDIVNNMSIKLPDQKIGNIIISTRDVKFDDSISIDDAKTTILKMVQYITQVQNANELLNKRINNIFENYIPKEKNEKIAALNKKLDEISSNLINVENKLTTITILENNDESKTLLNKYYDINNKIYNLKLDLKNVLINNENLEKVDRDIIDLEEEQLDYTKRINTLYDIQKSNIDILTLISKAKIILENKQKNLDEYISNSNLKEEKCIESIDQNTTCENVEIINKEEYNVNSKYLVDYLKTIIDSFEEKLKYYTPSDNNEVKITDEQKEEVLNEVIKSYNDYVLKENRFYLDNLNYLLKDTTYKLAKLPDYTDIDTIKDIEYIYIKLPQEIEKLLDEYSIKSTTQTNNLNSKLYNEILTILNSNIQINKQFNKLSQS